MIEITDVSMVEFEPDVLWGRYIDSPRKGEWFDSHMFAVEGWVLGRRQPVIAVELLEGEQVVRYLPVDARRNDLIPVFPHEPTAGTAGFSTIAAFAGDTEVTFEIRAVFQDHSRLPLGAIRARPAWREDRSGGPFISVVVPCFNQARFLSDAIESVLRQTYAHFEIVVVDDGSADNTEAIARRYPGVRYVRQTNQGLSAARNAGLRQSSGNFLVFLDADDRLTPQALEIGLAMFERNPACAMVAGKCRFIGADGMLRPGPPQRHVTTNYYEELLVTNYIWLPASVMYRRRVLDYVNGFDVTLSPVADYDMYLRIAKEFPIFCHEEVVGEYRRHGANMSGNGRLMLPAIKRLLRKHIRGRQLTTALEIWRQLYGGAIRDAVVADIQDRNWRKAWEGLLALARHHRSGLGSVAKWTVSRTKYQ